MTGYGQGQSGLDGGRLMLEIRALNHRFVDVRVRLPALLADRTFAFEQRCRERLPRGRYEVSVHLEGLETRAAFDLSRARAAYQALCRLRDEIAPGRDVPLEMLALMPDWLSTAAAPALDQVDQALEQALDQAWTRLTEMQRLEGAVLAEDLRLKLAAARALRQQIATYAEGVAQHLFAKTRQRVERLLGGAQSAVDPARLEQELAVLADKTDVDEELVRLAAHLDHFTELLSQPGPLGRKLDFLLQEVAREANTIAAKCQHAPIAHLVVELKGIVERIREQVQNVE